MNESPDPEARPARETAREFVYALPAGLVIFVHLLAAFAGLAGVIIGVADPDSGVNAFLSLLIPSGVLLAGVAGAALSAVFWARRSWWIFLVPACTLPGMLIGALLYAYRNWGY